MITPIPKYKLCGRCGSHRLWMMQNKYDLYCSSCGGKGQVTKNGNPITRELYRSECMCVCHTTEGIVHFVACCVPDPDPEDIMQIIPISTELRWSENNLCIGSHPIGWIKQNEDGSWYWRLSKHSNGTIPEGESAERIAREDLICAAIRATETN